MAYEIVNDISSIQLLQTRFEFDEANTMFYMKWLSLDIKSIEDFIEYYQNKLQRGICLLVLLRVGV